MAEKDYQLYGTKILNLKTQEIGLLICLWENKFADKTVDFATCVDKTGKRYNIEIDNIRGFEDDFDLNDIEDWNEFEQKYSIIKDIFDYFSRIAGINNAQIKINNSLLLEIYFIANYYIGNITKEEVQKLILSNFPKILFLIIWITKLENQDNDFNYIIDKSILKIQNLGELINIKSLILNKEEIIEYIKNIKIKDTSKIKNFIFNNLNEKHFPSLFKEQEKLYNIIEQNSNIHLIPYSNKISIAHLTQLFPLLEFKIRDLATYLWIVYFN